MKKLSEYTIDTIVIAAIGVLGLSIMFGGIGYIFYLRYVC